MSGTVYRDAWGVPHLRAADPLALAHLQGVNAATDRAWQLELARRRWLGTTAAFLGREALGWDTFARQARLADTARRCWDALDEDTRSWLAAYVDGVNEALPAGSARAPEFAATGLEPQSWEPWTPLGIWLAAHILFAGFPGKLWSEQVAAALGDDAVELFSPEGPISAGSNGWLISGDRTAAGTPIVAGDPHRTVEHPGVYQQVRLACPEYDVVGLAVPGVPGVAHFGHTGGVAWAITNAMADYQDLYAEKLRRTADGVEADGPDGWEPAEVLVESVEVAGQEPVEVEVIETPRGPVVIGGPGQDRAIALRYPPRVTARLGLEAIPSLLRATTVEDVDDAFDAWVEPVNVVLAADTDGGLLHRTAGLVPRRPARNQLRIVPADDPVYGWQGMIAPMPRATVEEYAVMANARGVATSLGPEFAAPHRARRIDELLDGRADWTAADQPGIHTDTFLGSADALLRLLVDAEGLSPAAGTLRDQLLAWDRRMDGDSTIASSYAALRKDLAHRIARQPALAALDVDAGWPELFQPWAEPLTQVFLALENLLENDLAGEVLPSVDFALLARESLEEVAGRNPRGPWRRTHQLAPLHALHAPLFAPEEEPIDLGVSGDHHCVWSTSVVPGLTDVCLRASVARFVWDVADRGNSAWVVPLGASGVPGDPHHHDQLPSWLQGTLVPIELDWDQLTPE